MRQGWLEGTTNMWPAGLLLCNLTLHSINLPLFPTYTFKKGGGLTCQECLRRVVKTASPRRGVMQLRTQLSRRATSQSDQPGRRGCVRAGREGESVWERVRTRGSEGRHARSQRDGEARCHRKASILTRSGLWKSQQPLTEGGCSETTMSV